MPESSKYTVFIETNLLCRGSLRDVLAQAKAAFDADTGAAVLIFHDQTGQIDFNLSGTLEEALDREAPAAKPRGPGRPRLGVVSREITLLPRHWDWLELQGNGASAALRRLVDDARRNESPQARADHSAGIADHFMSRMAGNQPNYEEAARALYAGEFTKLKELTADWPTDVRRHTLELATSDPAT